MVDSRLWIVTGAAGFLGNVLVRELVARGERVRAVLRSGLHPESLEGVACERVAGDVLAPASLAAAFAHEPGVEAILVHAAGAVSIASRVPPSVRATNVDGTANVVTAARAAGVDRLVYVSSVHALPEQETGVIRETTAIDPARVVGEYAATKAEATRLVLAAGDLQPVVVHPSGITGPGDFGDSHLTRLVADAASGRLPASVPGGYDFVDVRDVVAGIIAAGLRGRSGENYLLTAGFHDVRSVVAAVSKLVGRRVPPMVPLWLARGFARVAEAFAKLRNAAPLYTGYSLRTLTSNGAFDHRKASEELGFAPRPFDATLRDTVRWVRERAAGYDPADLQP